MSRILKLIVGVLIGASLAGSVHAALVGHWTFDEGGGTTIHDSSGMGNDGVLINAKANTWTNGISGGGLYFDGTTGAGSTYVSIPDSASLHITNAISFAAWIRCEDITRDAPILDKEADGKLCYWFGAFGAAGATPGNFGVLLSADGNQPWTLFDRSQGFISQGLWVHIASTWDGTTVRHYLNGVLLGQTASFTSPIHVSDTPLVIGANVPYGTTAFKGIVDEARLYNHALSQSEITALVGYTPQLVGHWSFDEGSGTNVADTSGLGNKGTITNLKAGTWTKGVSGSALYFDGTTGSSGTFVIIPDSPSLHIASGITFSAWVRCDDLTRDAPVLAKEAVGDLSYWFGTFGAGTDGNGDATIPGNFGVLLNAGGNDTWTIYDRDQGAIPPGQWVHLASTWNGATIRFYTNGQPLPDTGSFTGPIRYNSAFLAIGENSAKNFTAFKGVIDEVRLYNYALTSNQVYDLYLGGEFNITAVAIQGNDVHLAWQCAPGRSYVVQTNAVAAGGGFGGAFADLSAPIAVPTTFQAATTNFVHVGGASGASARYYRIKLLGQ